MAHDVPSIICDSSALVSITDSCFIHSLYLLRRHLSGAFIIPPTVRMECVDQPRRIRMHAAYALRLARAIQDKVLTVVELPDEAEVEEIAGLANSSFWVDGKPIRLLHSGEAECLALALQTGVDELLVDERTTRALIESPNEYTAHLKKEFGERLNVHAEMLETFLSMVHSLKFYRSSEIILMAYEKGYFDDYGAMKDEALEAALYRLKYTGCALTMDEIAQSVELERPTH